jgi:hypothetical protein
MPEDRVESEPKRAVTPDMSADEAVEVLYRNALWDLEDGNPDDAENPLSESDRERVRAYIRTGFRPGLSPEAAAELQDAAVDDLLRALEFGLDDSVVALLREVNGLAEVVTRIKQARQSATTVS